MTLSFWDFVAFFIMVAIVVPFSREWLDDIGWHLSKVVDDIRYFFKRENK